VEKIRGDLVEIERQIGGIEEGQQGLRTETEAAQEELNRFEIRLAESRSRTQFLTEEGQREFQADLAATDWRRTALALGGRSPGPQAA